MQFVIWQQGKFNKEINSSEKAMAHRVDLKIEEIKGDIKFLQGKIEWVEIESFHLFAVQSILNEHITKENPICLFENSFKQGNKRPQSYWHAQETGTN